MKIFLEQEMDEEHYINVTQYWIKINLTKYNTIHTFSNYSIVLTIEEYLHTLLLLPTSSTIR
jgi:hypothetical protein